METHSISNVELISDLLSRAEGDTLDFKRDQYKIGKTASEKQRSEFVKDILCMANTPRDEPAYILIGVEDRRGRAGEIVGTSLHPDPVDFQNLINDRTDTPVRFSYDVINYLGLELGLISIPVDRNVPVIVRNPVGKYLKKGVVYSRRNAGNCIASSHEIQRIVNWSAEREEASTAEQSHEPSWDSFKRACDFFDPARVYIAVVDGSQSGGQDDSEAFAQISWRMVLDLDQKTDEPSEGMFAKVEHFLSRKMSLNLTVLDEPLDPISSTACPWIAAKGLDSRPSTVQTDTWRSWNHVKPPRLSEAMNNLAQVTEPDSVTAVVFSSDIQYVGTICGLLDQAFKSRISFAFANEHIAEFSDLEDSFEGTSVDISFPAACAAIRSLKPLSEVVDSVELPRLDDGLALVPQERARWLEEDLEIVHTNLAIDPIGDGSELQDFLKGNPISWHGLSLGVDVARSLTPRLEQRLLTELDTRTARTVHLWHWPGGGGSTVARRVGWNIHTQYPTVIAKRVIPDSLRDRLQYIFSLTQKSILMLVEDSITNTDDLERLHERLRSGNVPVVVLRIGRREVVSTQQSSFYLDGILDRQEASAFAGRLIGEVPERRAELLKVRTEEGRLRTPFYFGLVAFERDFVSLEPYVSLRLSNVAPQVLEIAKLTSLLYHFGQQSTPVQLLSSIISQARGQRVNISEVIPELLRELYVQDSDRSIRPAHELIANETLEQSLGRNQYDQRNWRDGLAQCAIDVVEIAAKHHDHPGGAIANLVRSVIIERGTQETPSGLLEGRFSNLIQTIPSSDGQRRVLEKVTELFPDEAHFLAHLGRFYTSVRQHSAAHESHNMAIELSPNDSVLHHMAGMALRGELLELLEAGNRRSITMLEENQIQQLSTSSLSRFAKSRELNPRNEHSYISAIDLIAALIKNIRRLKGHDDKSAALLIGSDEVWYRELIDAAETLIAELESNRAGQERSRFLQRSRANLDEAYGNHSEAIQGWTNLLNPRSGAYRPPLRRNIINAYLNRSNRDWTRLNDRELRRIYELAEENLNEERDSDQNLRIWFRAARATGAIPLDNIAERLTYKSLRQPTVDTLYYLYIIKYLQSEMGIGIAVDESLRALEECSRLAVHLPNRTNSFEWLGHGAGIQSLVPQSALGAWNHDREFWSDTQPLRTAVGTISTIRTPRSSGEIELANGMKAYFVPSRGKREGGYLRGRDEGRRVQFFLGFSYDGLRAWDVSDAEV